MFRFNKILIIFILILSFSLIGCTAPANNTEALSLRISELEEENQALRDFYTEAYTLRNLLDIEARAIYNALTNQDIDFLKSKITSDTTFTDDGIMFSHDSATSHIKYSEFQDPLPTLRQRSYELFSSTDTFITGYEIHNVVEEYIPVIHFTFINEDGQWRLAFIAFE